MKQSIKFLFLNLIIINKQMSSQNMKNHTAQGKDAKERKEVKEAKERKEKLEEQRRRDKRRGT